MVCTAKGVRLCRSGSQASDAACFPRASLAFSGAMSHWSSRQVLALLLGLFVGLSLSLSAVQASTMAAKMTSLSGMAVSLSEMGSPDHGGCNAYGAVGHDQGTTKTAPCHSFCVPSVFAVAIPATVSITAPMTVMDRIVTAGLVLAGNTNPPDPYPPRSTDLA